MTPLFVCDPQVVVDAALLDMSHYRTHNVTVAFQGGLGSHMFQYAGTHDFGGQ